MADHPLAEQLDQLIDALLRGETRATESPLVEIALALRDLPDDNFKIRLKSDLERRTHMTAIAPARIREGFRTVTPYIYVAEGEKLVDFLKQTFGAQETARNPGSTHIEVRIGDSMLMIGSGEHVRGHEAPCAFHIFVEDCDAAYHRAIAAGATSLGEPGDRPYGERSSYVKDMFGNYWYIATRFPATQTIEAAGTVLPYLHPSKARPYIEFLKQAFGAEEIALHEQGGRVMHAAVRVGDSVLEMGEAGEEHFLASGFVMYVDDVDAVYQAALAAGATSVRAPGDRLYGHRDATIRDPFGFTWNPATLLRS